MNRIWVRSRQNQGVQVLWDAMPNRIWNGKVEQVPKQVVARGSRSVGEVLCSVDNDKARAAAECERGSAHSGARAARAFW